VTPPPSLAEVAPDVRVIAYYRLPDAPRPFATVSGEDLPEWIRVRTARPRFAGHEQPQIPGELGYCDVRESAARDAQAALARDHTVGGFCYVFRYSVPNGGLDPTLADILASGRPDFPFCVCWETTRLHGGAGFGPDDEAREPKFAPVQSVQLIRALLPVFADRRYLRVGGRPLFVVSSPDPIIDLRTAASLWRDECVRAGAGNPYLVCYGGALGADATQLGLDATIESPPLGGFPQSERDRIIAITPGFAGDARNYRSYVGQLLVAARPEKTMFRCIMPGWDETAREGDSARMFVDVNAETFGFWAERVVDQTRVRFAGDERLMFVRAWNEWDAGCHLEPDTRHGRQYLEALRAAVLRPPARTPERPSWETMQAWTADDGGLAATRVVRSEPRKPVRGDGPRVSVVMPAYNHERYVVPALDSVLAQTHGNLEIIVVDDGSRDATGTLLDEYAARCRTHAVTIVHQANAGAHEAINHGLALARGDVVAVMNSDDLYAPTRLERMLGEMDRRGAAFGFSNTRFIDDDGKDYDATEPYVRQLRKAIAEAAKSPHLLYVLILSNISMSTGNFVFRRELAERIGGFCAMRVCHDWDFLLAASFETPLAFVDEPLYLYRLHGTNTFSSSRVLAAFELEQLLTRFFDRIAMHPLLREPARATHFLEHVRRMGLGGYIEHTAGAGSTVMPVRIDA
jgi:glycosyltransferase involved in cell wall biosynthesis